MEGNGLYWAAILTDFGWVTIMGRGGKLAAVQLPKPTRLEAVAGIPADAEESEERFGSLPDQIRRYFAGERVSFDCEVAMDGLGVFEKRVLEETRKIPYGSVTSYGALAASTGRPGAARAVGNAMRKNPLPIVIPCHRVLRSDGSIGGFGGGADMKKRMLALEGV